MRKPEPILGLHWMGSKRVWLRNRELPIGKAEKVIDVFGGGGSCTIKAAQSDLVDHVVYNEIHPKISYIFESCLTGHDWETEFYNVFNSAKDMKDLHSNVFSEYVFSFKYYPVVSLVAGRIETYRKYWNQFQNQSWTKTEQQFKGNHGDSYAHAASTFKSLVALSSQPDSVKQKISFEHKDWKEFDYKYEDGFYVLDPPYGDSNKMCATTEFDNDAFWKYILSTNCRFLGFGFHIPEGCIKLAELRRASNRGKTWMEYQFIRGE